MCRTPLLRANLMDTASRGEAAMWEAQRASATRLDYGAKVRLRRGM